MSGGGSKPGERRGGRAKGTPNKRTALQVAVVEATGLTPLDFLTGIYQADPEWLKLYRLPKPMLSERVDAAKGAAPYIHQKMPSKVQLSTDPDGFTLVIKRRKDQAE